ncbi:hypothetical protein [Shimia sp. SDUM112013]|uniref:hypothetical protein n=1 Tax=Shimia sp. SDUM112013 TaxID=3136160 RepID=UPI0032EF8E0F
MPVPPFDDPWKVTDFNRKSLLGGPDALFFHARGAMARTLIAGKFPLMRALAEFAAQQGVRVDVVTTSEASRSLLEDPRHLHVFLEDVPIYGAGCFHAVPSYLRGYWYFDEIGTRNNATQRLRPFDPRPMSGHYARKVFARLHERFVESNRSKFDQPPVDSVPVAKGGLCFFAQTFEAPRYHKHYMTVPDMIGAAIAARGVRPLYIKPHPLQTEDEQAFLKGLHDPDAGVIVTDASIHALLAACDASISLSSAACFEGFLHKTPAVLGGQTDFAANAVTLTDPVRMQAALQETLSRDWPHEKFLTWFLKKNCVEDRAGQLPEVLGRIYRKGYLWADADGVGFY